MDDHVKDTIRNAMEHFLDSVEPYAIPGFNPFQRKQIHRHFERTAEFKVRAFRDERGETILSVVPVGKLQRMAETLVQEVLLSGESRSMPPMDSFERFIVHEYLKSRGGVRSESQGEGTGRHVDVIPLFGRVPKKAKRRLTR
jgi:predicted RNA-binding protein Jag